MGWPQRLSPADSWWRTGVPSTAVALSAYNWVGLQFTVTQQVKFVGARFFVSPTTHVNPGLLWFLWDDTNSVALRSGAFRPILKNTGAQWAQAWTRTRVMLQQSTSYRIAVLTTTQFFRTPSGLTSPVVVGSISANHGFQTANTAGPASTLIPTTNAVGVDLLYDPPGVNA